MNKPHLLVELNEQQLTDDNFSINIPAKNFPKKFYVSDHSGFCTGYFAGFEKKFDPEEIHSFFKNNKLKEFTCYNNEFLILFFDKDKKRLSILTDQTDKFALYFTQIGNSLLVSSDISYLMKQQPRRSVDLDIMFTALDLSWHITDKTILREIKQLPGGALLSIDAKMNWQIKYLVDLKRFLNGLQKPYTSYKAFVNDYMDLFFQIVKERIGTLTTVKLCSDLSSGFDCPLVAYLANKVLKSPLKCFSGCSSYTQEDTNIELMSKFAKLHNLDLEILYYEDRFSGKYPEWKEWQPDDLLQLKAGRDYTYHQDIAKQGYLAKLNGWGGDELYTSYALKTVGYFPIQGDYFAAIRKITGMQQILTPDAITVYTSWLRFQSRTQYQSIISPTASFTCRYLSPIAWELDLWPITPFMDTRLIKLFTGLPKTNDRYPNKQEVLKNANNIFLPEMFTEKGGMENVIVNFLIHNTQFVQRILSNSILAEANFVKPGILLKRFSGNNKSFMNYESDTASYFYQILQIEYFLQENNIYLKL